MAKNSPHQTHFTRQVQLLLAKIYGRSPLKDSVLEKAIGFYEHVGFVSSVESENSAKQQLIQLEKTERYARLTAVCREIIELSEGENFAETNIKSAKLLGTIQLLSPTEGNKVAANNERCKSLYKAVLSLRLLDRLCIDKLVVDPYIFTVLKDVAAILTNKSGSSAKSIDIISHPDFIQQVKIPLVMTALLQDIGIYHPDAQAILLGEKGDLDPFRVLDIEHRKALLQINYRETTRYLVDGIGIPIFIGNTKEKREEFNLIEQEKFKFIKSILKNSFNPKNGIGNLLKVPQIYTSIILSTKSSYNYKLLPKVYQALNKNAERGSCSQKVVDALYQITGMFPQGFGVVYIPTDDFGEHSDSYEYAIVNQFYPPQPDQPLCRISTRQLAFIGYGQNVAVKITNNLYHAPTAKKIALLSKERLNEILELLSSNYQERQKLDLLPRCWHANEFFSVKSNQNLWNKLDK
ncbi:MAG: hypothetical protein OCD00_01725 [Colwellia sp.]